MNLLRLFVACVVSMLAGSLYAQVPYGRVTGRVVDSAGAVVPGAHVRATNTQTNVVVSTATDQQGNYDVRNLIPGQYRLEVEMQGFKLYERQPIEVRVGDAVTVNVALELGTLTEKLTITAESPMLDAVTANSGQVIENRRLMDLPMPNGILMYLVQSTPGIIATTCPTCGFQVNAPENVSGLSVGGVANNSSEFLIDGVPNMKGYGVITLLPGPEFLQEMRVSTADYDASSGHYTGAQVNMVTKSGTNSLHSVLTYGYDDRWLRTHTFFLNKDIWNRINNLPPGSPESAKQSIINEAVRPSRNDRYRGTASGPLYIPKVYDGRNRTFWNYAFDRWVNPSNYQTTNTVPTLAERNGDLSALLSLGSQYQIYDPATIAPAAGGLTSRQPLAGNLITPVRIDPMAKRLLTYFPLPTRTGNADGTDNVFSRCTDRNFQQNHIVRVDHTISQNNRIFGTLTRAKEDTPFDWMSGFRSDFLRWRFLERDSKLALDNVLTPRPDLVVNLRASVSRVVYQELAENSGFNLAELGFPASLVSQLDRTYTTLPAINIAGFATVGSGNGNFTANTTYFLNGGVSHTRGKHSLRLGSEYRVYQRNYIGLGAVSPSISFDTTWTRGPSSTSPAAPFGQGMASFLLGLPTGGGIDKNASRALQSGYMTLFAQDDWKVSPKLTLSAGLRWEMESATSERYNRAVRGYDFAAASPIQDAARAVYALNPIPEVPASNFRTIGGLLFAGVNSVPRTMWNADKNNFSPRIGLAYAWRAKTAVRAGYGIYFETLGADRSGISQPGFSRSTSLVPSLDNGLTFRATLANPFPDPLLQPVGASLGLKTNLGNSVSYTYPDRRPGYVQRWSLNIQQEFPARVLLEVGYAGNRATGLGMSENLDLTPDRYLSRSPERDQATIDFLANQFPNPFYGMPEFAGSGMTGKNLSRSALLRPYPQFGGVTATFSTGYSWYHSLQVRAEKRFSHGLILQASYTWSKLMDASSKLNATDLFPQHVVAGYDRPQHLAATGIYELPFGRGKYFLPGAPAWANHVIGGWSVQAMYQGQSGAPLGFGNIIFRGDIHNIVVPRSQRTIDRWFNTDAGFEKSSTKQLGSNVRTFPSRLTGLRGDGINNWDMSVFKNFKITEKMTFQLRAEAVNALNHAIFGGPNTSPTSLNFGKITGNQGGARTITIGGRLSF